MKKVLALSLAALLVSAGAWADDNKTDDKKPGQPPAGAKGVKPGAGKKGQPLEKLLANADTNKDGKISLEEFTAAAEKAPGGKLKDNADKAFKRLDANGDGYITKEEIKKAMEQRADKKPGEKKPGKKPNDK